MIVQVVEQVPAQGACIEVVLVGMAAEGVRIGFNQPRDSALFQSGRSARLGLSLEQLLNVQAESLRKDEEIHNIASMLVR